MANTLRFGVVGLGMGMNRSSMIHDTDGAELVAVADLVARHKVAQSEYAEAGQGLSEKGATVDVFEVL